MAVFKVNQRVRIVNPEPHWPGLRGREAVIVRIGPSPLRVLFGGRKEYEYGADVVGCGVYNFYAWELAPLADPRESEWAADKVRQVTKPQHIEPVAPEKLPALDKVLDYYRSLGGS